MGFVKDTFDSITGKGAEKAARKAGKLQAESADKALELTRESRDIARGDLSPFREAGQGALNPLVSLVQDPQAQRQYVEDNPFFNSLLSQSRGDILQNAAARGKLGSGGTLKALDENVLTLGPGLVQNQINNLSNLANMGQASAAGQANVAQNAGAQGSNLITQRGNALASGQVGAANARSQGTQNLLSLAGMVSGMPSLGTPSSNVLTPIDISTLPKRI